MLEDKHAIRLLLSNARSLLPKIDSLKDAFRSLNLSFACITETWFRGGSSLRDTLVDFEGSTGIKILHRSRDGRMRKTGGGVAIAFDTSCCNFKRRHLGQLPKGSEVICATGRVGKVDQVVVVFAVYIAPGTRAAELDLLREGLTTEITQIRMSITNPIVIVGGDFNHRDVNGALNDAGEFEAIPTGPTRGSNTIDIIFTNSLGAVNLNETRTLPPLQSAAGSDSDHKCVYTALSLPPTRSFRWVCHWRRTRNKEREAAFASDLKNHDWTSMVGNVDEMVSELNGVVADLTEKHFPLARIRKRSNESPWITRKIRRIWKRKVRIYKKGGRSPAWWATERDLQSTIEKARHSFVDRMVGEGTQGRSFYAVTRKLASTAPANQWSVGDLFPGKPPAEVCSEVLRFYGNISGEGASPMPDLPRVGAGLEQFLVERTTKLLAGAKKSDSRVDGDPLAHLVRCYPDAFAVPVPSTTKLMKTVIGRVIGRLNILLSYQKIRTRPASRSAET